MLQSPGTFGRVVPLAAEAIWGIAEAGSYERMVANRGRSAMSRTYVFGPFRLDVEGDVLFRGAAQVALGRRAVALLRVLVVCAGVEVSTVAFDGRAGTGF